jgi:uroporphyrinogen III methyltransferase / synthase
VQIKAPLKIGSRSSRLALIQVEEVLALLKEKGISFPFKHILFKTAGDRDKKTSLVKNTQDDFFTNTLDRALLKNEIDLAIHSAKDLPQRLHPELSVFALTAPTDDTDSFVGRKPIEKLAKGSKIGTSSLIRQNQIKKLYPHLKFVDIRGTIEERLNLLDQGKCDGIIVATIALKRLGLTNLISNIMPWEGAALQGQLAIVGRKSDEALQQLLKPIDARKHYGTVTLVGAGPGDPGLITVKGMEALQKAECVFYDYLVHKSLLDYAKQAEKIYVGKRKGEHTLSQDELSRQLKHKALEGKNIVRLKGGDPFIFGRGADEIEYLSSYHIPIEVIPGVSSATGIPSSLQVPLTSRKLSSSVAFLSAHGEDETRTHAKPITIPKADTLVFLMGLSKLDVILKSLKKAKWKNETPILIISKGTRTEQKIVQATLGNIVKKLKENPLDPPALIIVGNVVQFYKEKNIPKLNVLYTGTHPEKHEALGHLIMFPMISITPAKLNEQEQKNLASALNESHIILFTSYFGVQSFFESLKKYKISKAGLNTKDFVVIGKGTADTLRGFDMEPKYIAEDETSEGTFATLKKHYDLKGKRILFPRSSLPNPFLKTELEKSGAVVSEVAIYVNTKPAKRPLPQKPIDMVFFSSPSTVMNFLKDYDRIPDHWRIGCKGPATQKALERAGYKSEMIIYG